MNLDQNFLTFQAITVDGMHVPLIEKQYVCGFLFAGTYVALIRKNRPTWQKGRLNGIGGSIEKNESPLDSMIREFQEETGATVTDWRCFAILRHLNALVYMFVSHQPIASLRQTTDEEVNWWDMRVSGETIRNLNWLLPLALSPSREVALIADDSPLPEPLQ